MFKFQLKKNSKYGRIIIKTNKDVYVMKKVISNLSLLRKTNTVIQYEHNIEAVTVNEAALKYIMTDESIDEIILLISSEVYEHKFFIADNTFTTLEYIISVIEQFCKKNNRVMPSIIKINTSQGYDHIISETISRLSSGDELYFDVCGGFRDIAMINMLLINLARFKGIKLCKMIYTELNGGCGRFKDVKYADSMISLINASSEFTKFGKCNGFTEYIKENSASDSVKALVEAMKSISESIELGRASNVEEDVKNISEKMTEVEKENSVFSLLIPTIRSKLFGGIEHVDWLNIISWCVENDMINQALTFFVEKAPDAIFDSKIIECTEDFGDTPKSTLLYEKFLDSSANSESEFKKFKSIIHKGKIEYWAKTILNDINSITGECFGEELAKKPFKWLQKLSPIRYEELIKCKTREKFINQITNGPCYYYEIRNIKRNAAHERNFEDFKNVMRSYDDCIAFQVLKDIETIPDDKINFGDALLQKNPVWLQALSQNRRAELTECNFKKAFINQITNSSCYYNEIMGNVQSNDSTNIKKIKQIMCLSEKQNGFICRLEAARNLCIIYLYIKIVRNHVCHVSEQTEEDPVVEFLRENGCEIDPISIDNIKNNITLALNIIKTHESNI